jgi:hypothetical protein
MPELRQKPGKKLNRKLNMLIYAVAFQVGWFICILMGNLVGIVYTFVFLTCHCWFLVRDNRRAFLGKEVLWILLIASLGSIVEIISFSSGLLYMRAQEAPSFDLLLPPIWLSCIWIIFAIALRTCLSFLFNNLTLSCFLCVIFVPINYYAGVNLNHEVAINDPIFLNLTLITFIWVLFLCCITYLKKHFFEEICNAN